jgi:predicted oxidoreductase
MKTVELGKTGIQVPNVSLGCMRMHALNTTEAAKVIEAAIDTGIDFFDHADIYGKGESERTFAQALKETGIKREEIVLQSKTGIRQGFYDFSKDYIVQSVEGILKRLETDYLDVLLLHRPDALMEPEEVAEAFDKLHTSGKVKHFGVSNHNPYQLELLKKYVKQDLVTNQLQMSVMHTGMVDAGINVNRKETASLDHDGGILDYARLHDMTVQPWSPIQGENGVFLNDPEAQETNDALREVGANYGLDHEATAIAWLLRHPAKMQIILGTMTPERIKNYAKASEVEISREEWYSIYRSAGNPIP